MESGPIPHELRGLQSSWQQETLFLALSVSSTLPSNLFGLLFPWTQAVSLCKYSEVLSVSNFPSLVLSLAPSRVSSTSPTLGIRKAPHGFSLPELNPGKSLKVVSWGNHKFISFVSQFSGITALFYLISSTWYLVPWLPLSGFGLFLVLFFGFWFIFFLDVSSKRVKYSPCYSILVRAAFFFFSNVYPHTNIHGDYMHQNKQLPS